MNNRSRACLQLRRGASLVEMMLLIVTMGSLMILTLRTLHLGTQVNQMAIRTTTHLRLVESLEDRLRGTLLERPKLRRPRRASFD